MGRGVKFKVRGADGAPRSVIGSFVGAIDEKTGQVYVSKDPNGLPDGFYNVDSSNAQEFVANLDEAQLAEKGIELGKDVNGRAVGERAKENIPNINEVSATPAPAGWEAIPGTFGGKKVIQTEDGDFRVHFGGKDETVLLEDHRAAPGQADPQRSVAEAFKRVGDVDIQREESGDQAYAGLAGDNEEKLANRDRDSKVEQIKGNERTILNERANLGAKQSAMTANETLKAELEAEGQPYDPDGFDSDEKIAARKTATEGAPEAADPAAPEAGGAPTASTGEIDLSTFEVAPEGFLVPTGKKTNDISRDGLANFMTAEKEQLSQGGSRLVVDTDTGEAEIYNSADTLENAQAQAGGIGVPQVLDLSTGQAVNVGEPDPNAGDPNVDLSGDTVDAQNSNPNAVEPGPAQPTANDPAQPVTPGQDGSGGAPAASPADPGSGDPSADAARPDSAPGADGTGTSPEPDASSARPGSAPGSVEELKERRTQVQAALDVAGDPKDIIALNEQADELDTRIRREELGAALTSGPKNGEEGATVIRDGEDADLAARLETERKAMEGDDESVEVDFGKPDPNDGETEARLIELSDQIAELEAASDQLTKELEAGSDRADDDIAKDIDEAFEQIAKLQEEFELLNSGPSDENDEPEMSLQDKLDSAWAATDPFPDSNLERRERAALRILRDAEKKGDLESGINRLSDEEKAALSDDIAEAVGIPRAKPEPEPAPEEAPEAPEAVEAPEAPEAAPEAPEPADEAPAAPEPAPELPEYVEPGDIEAVAAARGELNAIDTEIENELARAEATANDPMEQAGHLSRVRTLERQRKVYQNALDRALGNAPMDFNKDLGWSLRDKENRGALPEAPTPEPEVEEIPEADTPAVLDEELTPDAAPDLTDIGPSSLREGDFIAHPETGNIVKINTIDAERYPEERDTKFTIGYESRNEFEENENNDSGGIELWGSDKVDTYKGWREAPQPDPVGPPPTREAAERRYDQATSDYFEVLMKDDYTEAEYEAAETRREEARADYLAFDAEEEGVAPETQALLDELDADPETARSERAADQAYQEYLNDQNETDELPDNVIPIRNEVAEVNRELADRDEVEAKVGTDQGLGGLYDGGDDPYDVESGNNNKVESIKAKSMGKDLTPEERAELDEALNSGVLSDSQVARIAAEVDAKPNAANTTTISRPENEQPEFMNTADVDIVDAERNDPNFVFDEDLTWRKILEENPNAQQLENGDLILDTVDNKGKRYDLMIRRTNKNRFMTYVMETDQNGNRRAKRISGTEWHSYEALENRIAIGRKLIHSKSPAGSLARRKDQPTEDLGTQGFPSDDFIGDIGNPDAPLPATGDEKFDRLLAVAAEHIRNGDADLHGIEAHLQELDPGANAINTIMNAIIGRAQDNYRPDGVAPWQTYDGGTAEIGAEYDWTDWHQEKNWWLPNGQLNPDRKPNPTYGEVHRVRVMGYVKENTDGKGHTYGDHVWVSVYDPKTGTWGNWTKRSAQTLRPAEAGSGTGLPFFSKREEWRSSPEALARRFRVPQATPEEPVKTQPRPKGDLPSGRRLRFTSRGNLAGYSNTAVPSSKAEIAGMILSGEITPTIAPANTARPGMIIFRRDDAGNMNADSIIRVENLGDGGYRIHAARPDGKGFADVDSFVVPGDADIALGSAPGFKAPRQPEPSNDRQGELVSFTRDGVPDEGVVVFDDGKGNVMVNTPSGETVDILESNITPVESPEVSQEERQDLLSAMDDHAIPQYIKDLIRQGLFSPGLSAERYQQLVEVAGAFETRSAEIREVDVVLDIIGATDQQRTDVHEFFNATGTE